MTSPTWKRRIVDLLMGGPDRKPKPRRAARLRDKHIPSSLFRYRSVNDQSLGNLESGTEWLSSADAYNDPFDSASVVVLGHPDKLDLVDAFLQAASVRGLPIDIDADELEAIRAAADPHVVFLQHAARTAELDPLQQEVLVQTLDEVFKGTLDWLQKVHVELSQRAIRVCSLSEDPLSILMWSHYADNHRGYCIEYDTASRREGVRRELHEILWPVCYQNTLPDRTYLLRGLAAGTADPKAIVLSSIAAALVKSPDWSYEHEWRIAVPAGLPASKLKANTGVVWSAPKPKRLLMGCKIVDEDAEKVLSIAASKEIPVAWMVRDPSSFRIHITDARPPALRHPVYR